MEEFALIFRIPAGNPPSEEQMKAIMVEWNNWLGVIAAQNKHVSGVRLGRNGKVLRPSGVITDGPFAELKEELGGFNIVRAKDIDEAITLAHGCPIFKMGGNIEIRPVAGLIGIKPNTVNNYNY
jgi:hypothetical protein